MSETSYIYPHWYRARRSLAAAIQAAGMENVESTIEAWFRGHVFEVGSSYRVREMDLEQAKIDIPAMVKHQCCRILVARLEESGLLMATSNPSGFGDEVEYSYTALVFGSPPAVGPGTREAGR